MTGLHPSGTARVRRQVAAGLVGIAVVWCCGVWLSRTGGVSGLPLPSAADRWGWSWGTAPHAWRDAWVAVCRFGDGPVVAVAGLTLGAVVAVARRRERLAGLVRAAAVPFAVMAAGAGCQLVAKPVLGRHIGEGLVDSYPSGHATGTAALVAALLLAYPFRRRPTLRAATWMYPAMVGFAMWALHSHYPTDVVAGWVWGASVVAVVDGAARAVAGPLEGRRRDRGYSTRRRSEAPAEPVTARG